MKASSHVFASDLIEEGYGTVLNRLHDAGLTGVVFAGTYHHARDIFPHNPIRKVGFHDGGTTYFRPDPARYSGLRIQPQPSVLTREGDPLGRLLDEARNLGMDVRVWTNNLHNSTMGERYPDCATRNAFGDLYPYALCPANPDVRAYVVAISADIARYGVTTLIPESVYYQPFEHGHHHERSHYPYSATVKFLLGLCFCEHCRAAALTARVDFGRIHGFVRDVLQHVISGEPSALDDLTLDPSVIGAIAGGEMARFLEVRRAMVTGLVAEIVAALDAIGSTRVCVMDWSGGLASYASGQLEGSRSIDRGWLDGIDATAIARAGHGLSMLAYTHDLDRFRDDVAAYRDAIPSDRTMSLALRPMPPDCIALDELDAKLDILRDFEIDWVEFYHYGLLRLTHLAWVEQALRKLSGARAPSSNATRVSSAADDPLQTQRSGGSS